MADADPPSPTPEVSRLLREGEAAGRTAYGPLALDADRFDRAVLAAVARRPVEGESVADAVARRAVGDLWLAVAADLGVPGAFDAFYAHFEPRLRAMALRMLGSAVDADALATEVLGDLALAPRSGAARTVLGTFDGSGSLFGWLAAILARRVYARGKKTPGATEVALDPGDGSGASDPPVPPTRGEGRDPLEGAVGRERASGLRAALEAAWARATPNERFVLVGKFRDGLEQRALARSLGVGAPRVTRLVQQVVEKVRAVVATALGGGGDAGPEADRDALDVVQRWLATRDGTIAPTGGGPSRGGMHG